MNFSQSTWSPLASPHAEMRDAEISEWLGGEAWVTPQPFASECFVAIDPVRDGDPANDWIPL